jgi:hypothetical protein
MFEFFISHCPQRLVSSRVLSNHALTGDCRSSPVRLLQRTFQAGVLLGMEEEWHGGKQLQKRARLCRRYLRVRRIIEALSALRTTGFEGARRSHMRAVFDSQNRQHAMDRLLHPHSLSIRTRTQLRHPQAVALACVRHRS